LDASALITVMCVDAYQRFFTHSDMIIFLPIALCACFDSLSSCSVLHKQMLSHLHVMVNKNYLAIPKEHEKLITSLRTAYATEYSLDKEQTSYIDLLDALRLSLKGYQIT